MGQWSKKALQWKSYFLLRVTSAVFALVLLFALIAVPTDEDQNIISAFLHDQEYGILSDTRLQATNNRLNAERILSALNAAEYDASQEPIKFPTSYAANNSCTVQQADKLENVSCSPESSNNIARANNPIDLQYVAQTSKPPKPYKMNEYDFDPDLLSLTCRPDFDYCMATCDHNENGKVDEDVVVEVQCVAYCMRQAVSCEYDLCKDKYEKLKASIFKWGGVLFLVTFLLVLLPPARPLGAATLVVGILMMFFSTSPLMTWIGYMNCG